MLTRRHALAQGGSDAAAQPVETLLAALIGCEQATAAFVARHMQPRMDLLKIEFNYCAERDNRAQSRCRSTRSRQVRGCGKLAERV